MEKQLALLREKYLVSLPNKVNDIRVLWESLLENKDLESIAVMHRMAHSLSGSGATFGVDLVAQSAKILENHIKDCGSNELFFNPENISQSEKLLSDLEDRVSAG